MIDSIGDQRRAGYTRPRPLVERLEQLFQTPYVGGLLAPAAFIYGVGSYLRILSFSIGLAARAGVSVPVISVGNVTVGGTGKTPVVIDLADRLSSQGFKVAILSRGYGRRSKAKTIVVSTGSGPLVTVDQSGDEPYMMARAVPSAIVIVGSKRNNSACLAVESYGAQIIILDDGFQHVQLKRDIDVVLLDYGDDLDSLTLLPSGRLREPLAALGRASAIVITKIPTNKSRNEDSLDENVKNRLELICGRLSQLAPAAVLYYLRFVPSRLLAQSGNNCNVLDLTALSGKRIFALCGIARPDGFFESLAKLGAIIADQMTFCDHHWFTSEDVGEIDRRFRESGADYIVTSEKDSVRLPLSADLSSITYALMIEAVWLDMDGARVSAPALMHSVLALAKAGSK